MENKAAKAEKKQTEERVWLKRMAVAAVRRQARLEGGDEEAEEVTGRGGRNGGDGSQGGTRAIEGRVGGLMLTTLSLHRAGSD